MMLLLLSLSNHLIKEQVDCMFNDITAINTIAVVVVANSVMIISQRRTNSGRFIEILLLWWFLFMFMFMFMFML